ncbi:glycosyl hydrolase family 61 [Phlyctema vagabunda]|uniref:Glycosyl hydrolase family 61 n=1 Tax=Phlyctema vagabunda TaxID=108571 RepID=A0ABR4P594_9HELO
MLRALKIATVISGWAATVQAHGYVSGTVANGVYAKGWQVSFWYDLVNKVPIPQTPGWYEEALDLGFIAPDSYQTPNIICHKNAVNANVSTTVPAGGYVDFQWTTWAHNIGPVLTYVANCGGDCKSVDKKTLKFVKIDESGIDFTTQVWATGALMNNNNTWRTTVPKTLAPGHYVFRHEIIALHGATSLNGAQNYPFCSNIDVTGSGTQNPVGTLAVNLYKNTDPGIYFNPYVTLTNYTIPGPALWKG